MRRRQMLTLALLGGCAAAPEERAAAGAPSLLSARRTVAGGFLALPSPVVGLPARPGTGAYVKLLSPGAVALRGNDLLVADIGSARLWRADVALATLTGIGGAPVGPRTALALGPDLSAWVLDPASRRVLRFGRDGRLLQTFRADSASAMALADAGNTLLLAEGAQAQWTELRSVGATAVPVLPERDDGTRVSGVDAVAPGRSGVFVLDRLAGVVLYTRRDGRVLARLGAGELKQPVAIAADRFDRVFVVDAQDRAVKVLRAGDPTQTLDAARLGVQQIGGIAVDDHMLAVSDSLAGQVVLHQLAAGALR